MLSIECTDEHHQDYWTQLYEDNSTSMVPVQCSDANRDESHVPSLPSGKQLFTSLAERVLFM